MLKTISPLHGTFCCEIAFTPSSTSSGWQWAWLLGTGLFAAGGQVFLTLAYHHAPAAQISIWGYNHVLFSLIIGLVVWGERGQVQAREKSVLTAEEQAALRDAQLEERGNDLGALSKSLDAQAETVGRERAENALGLQLVEKHRRQCAEDLKRVLFIRKLGPVGALREILLAIIRLGTGS